MRLTGSRRKTIDESIFRISASDKELKLKFKCVITFTRCLQMHAFCTYQCVPKQCTRLLICINGENEVGDTFPFSMIFIFVMAEFSAPSWSANFF